MLLIIIAFTSYRRPRLLFTVNRFLHPQSTATEFLTCGTSSAAAAPPSSCFSPPPHSVAVLPFVNMSGDKEQEYFSDGLTEEILNSLTESTNYRLPPHLGLLFPGDECRPWTIARKLNVGAVLEGSVRRSGDTVRITAQLIDAISGFHLGRSPMTGTWAMC